MRANFALLIAVTMIGASGGCGSSTSSQDNSRTEAEKQQALRDSAFGSMVETMDRARGVEQLQLDRKARLDAALENSETQ